MIAMEIEVTSSLNNNNSSSSSNSNNRFYSTATTGRPKNFLLELQEQLSDAAETMEKIFERVPQFPDASIPADPDKIQKTHKELFFFGRLKSFYGALVEILECFHPSQSRLVRVGELDNHRYPLIQQTPESYRIHSRPCADATLFSDTRNNNPADAYPLNSALSDVEVNKIVWMKCDGAKFTSGGSVARENPRPERPKSLFTSNPSLSDDSVGQPVQNVVEGSSGRSIGVKHVCQSRKNYKRFVTTAVTGAEIAAAYHTLAATKFRMSDWLGKQEKTRHSSFVSRGTSTPKRKEELALWFTQSLPSLPPHSEGQLPVATQIQAAPSISCSQLHQQQTQTTPATRDASTSPEGIPRADKAVQVRHGEILEPVDKFHPQPKLDRYKKRHSNQFALHKIVEEVEDDAEESPNKRKFSFPGVATQVKVGHCQCPGTSSLEKLNPRISRELFGCWRETQRTEKLYEKNSADILASSFSSDRLNIVKRIDSPRPQCKTIDYFFTSK